MVGNMLINHLFYADDLCIFSPSSKGLQILLNTCFDCGLEWDIRFNEKKCKIMVFKSNKFRNIPVPRFFIGGKKLDECTSYKYLGHFITNDRKDHVDISRQCKYIYAKGNTLIRNFGKCSDFVKVTLFKAFCTSLYTAQLWCDYTQSALNKLKVAYHSILKQMLNYPRYMSNSMVFVHHGAPTFQELVRKYVYSFRNRMSFSSNEIIMTIMNSGLTLKSRLMKHWEKILY